MRQVRNIPKFTGIEILTMLPSVMCFVAEEYVPFVDEISVYWAAFNLLRDVFMNSVCGFSTWEKGLERIQKMFLPTTKLHNYTF